MAGSAVALVTTFTFDFFFFPLCSVLSFLQLWCSGDSGSWFGSWGNGILRVYGIPLRGCNDLDDLHEIRFLSLLNSLFLCLFYIRDEV